MSIGKTRGLPPGKLGKSRATLWTNSDLHCRSAFFDFVELMKFPRSAAWTFLTRTFPILGSSEVAVPKRPSFTLTRSSVVNLTLSRFIIKENAVTVTELFQATANANFASVLLFKFFNRQLNESGDSSDLFLVNPYITRRTSTAVATAGASELQSVFIPRLVGAFFCHWFVRFGGSLCIL